MKPKKEAKILVDKLRLEIWSKIPALQSRTFGLCITEAARQCALICVDSQLELINLINNDGADDYYDDILQMKEEIKKL